MFLPYEEFYYRLFPGRLLVGFGCVVPFSFLLIMECLQLDLFSGRVIPSIPEGSAAVSAPSFEGASDYDVAAKRQGIDSVLLNPCGHCDLQEFCSDECAKLLFSVDSKNEPKSFSRWLLK